MSSLFYAAGKGPCKIEITTADGEKFSYNAMITQHELNMGPSTATHMFGNGIVEESLGSRNKEVTLKFIELSPTKAKTKPKPIMKGIDAQLREAIEQEEML